MEELNKKYLQILISHLMSDATAKHRPGPQTD